MSSPRENARKLAGGEDKLPSEMEGLRKFDLRFAKVSSDEWRVTSGTLQLFKESGDANSAAVGARFQKMGMLPSNPSRPSLDEAVNTDRDFHPDMPSAYRPMESAMSDEGQRIKDWRLEFENENRENWRMAGIEGLATYASWVADGAVMRTVLAKNHVYYGDHSYSKAVDSALTFVDQRLESAAGATDEDVLAKLRLLSLDILRHQRLATHLEALSSVIREAITVGKEAIVCDSLTIAYTDDASLKAGLEVKCEFEARNFASWEQNIAIWDDTAAEATVGAKVFLQHRSDFSAALPPEFHETYQKEIASMISRSSARELVSELAAYQLLSDDAGEDPHPAGQSSGKKLSKSARRAARQRAKVASSTANLNFTACGRATGGRNVRSDSLWSFARAAIRRSIQKIDSATIEASAPPSGPWEPVSSTRTHTRGTGVGRPLPKSLIRHEDDSRGSGLAPSSYSSYGDTFNEMFWKPLTIGEHRWWRQNIPDPEFEPAPLLAGPTPTLPTLTSREEEELTGAQQETMLRLRQEQLQLQGTPAEWERARGWVTSTEQEHPGSPLTEHSGPSSEDKATADVPFLDDEMASPSPAHCGFVALHSLLNAP